MTNRVLYFSFMWLTNNKFLWYARGRHNDGDVHSLKTLHTSATDTFYVNGLEPRCASFYVT